MPTQEFHIVGGLHPKLRLSYYTDMIRGLKERHPDVHIKALTAVEIAHLARIEKATERDVLIALKDAGLTSLPGGGAEVFSTAVRATIAERKLTGEEWLRVHRVAHELGIPSNCTMLYGHVETADDRIEHLGMLRELQDETGGFLTYIPLAYHPDNNELGEELGRVGSATTGYEDLQEHRHRPALPGQHPPREDALADGDAVPVADRARFGCDDVEGTVVYERIYHEAGAHTAMHMHYDQLVELIRGAGKRPVERDSLYRAVREDFDDRRRLEPGGFVASAPAVHARMRLGRIPWINCYPVYGAIDRGVVPLRRRARDRDRVRPQRSAGRRRARRERGVRRRVRPQRRGLSPAARPRHQLRRPGAQRRASSRRRPVAELDGATVLLTLVLPHLGAAARAALPPSLEGDSAVRHRAGRGHRP